MLETAMSKLTKEQLGIHLREMAEAKQAEIYYAYRDAVLAHDAALRAKLKTLGQDFTEKMLYVGQLERTNANLVAERDRLKEAVKDVVDSFEMDYMIDGVIVDNPHGQGERLYRVCKAALRGEPGGDDED
jgi:hypothetical protein